MNSLRNAKNRSAEIIQLFVSPGGNDRWSGRSPSPNKAGTDGPFATIDRARMAVRKFKTKGKLPRAVRVVLRGGSYELPAPLVFSPEDSGSPVPTDDWNRVTGPRRDLTYAAYPGEQPVVSGGRRLDGWTETTVHGHRAWVTPLPEVVRGKWYFTQLWVNGRRAHRPRLPAQGNFRIEKPLGKIYWSGNVHKVFFTGQDRFRFARGDLRAWRNVRDIEFVALHFWIESRIPLRKVRYPETGSLAAMETADAIDG